MRAGDAVVKLSAGTRTVTKNFKIVAQCAFDTFCSSSNGLGAGGIADPRVFQGFPPTDDTCNVKYYGPACTNTYNYGTGAIFGNCCWWHCC